jgi:hypothetical protein
MINKPNLPISSFIGGFRLFSFYCAMLFQGASYWQIGGNIANGCNPSLFGRK